MAVQIKVPLKLLSNHGLLRRLAFSYGLICMKLLSASALDTVRKRAGVLF